MAESAPSAGTDSWSPTSYRSRDYMIKAAEVPMNWDEEASCQAVDPNVFFPERPSDPARIAKQICRGCPVRMQCLEFALAARLDHGVWGGLTEIERRSLRRSRQRKARREALATNVA